MFSRSKSHDTQGGAKAENLMNPLKKFSAMSLKVKAKAMPTMAKASKGMASTMKNALAKKVAKSKASKKKSSY